MCGLAGVFLGDCRSSSAELQRIARIFTRLLSISEIRGTHAAGVAILDRDGRHEVLKRPVTASKLIRDPAYDQLLRQLGTKTTLLMGHARWATRGRPEDNENNHPLIAGNVIGTHNGTIWNADELFERFGFDRTAEVDSEILVRLADRAQWRGSIDVERFVGSLGLCRGQMSAVIASRLDPGRLLLFRGNNPLAVRYEPRRRHVIYASESLFLDAVLAGETGWRSLPLPAMHYLDVRADDPGDAIPRPFRFLAEGPETAPTRAEPDSLIHRVLRERAWNTDVVREKANEPRADTTVAGEKNRPAVNRETDSKKRQSKKRRPSSKAELAAGGTRKRKGTKGDTE